MDWACFCEEKIIREGGNREHYMELFEELLSGADYSRRRMLLRALKS